MNGKAGAVCESDEDVDAITELEGQSVDAVVPATSIVSRPCATPT